MKLILLAAVSLLSACSIPPEDAAVFTTEEEKFAPVRAVLESNCVHCHDDNRLSTMPPINDTLGLSKLISSGWIVPGRPEQSRFFQVVTFSDDTSGAMPPSGHAISKAEVRVLKNWIKWHAKLPLNNIKLRPQGPLPRSI